MARTFGTNKITGSWAAALGMIALGALTAGPALACDPSHEVAVAAASGSGPTPPPPQAPRAPRAPRAPEPMRPLGWPTPEAAPTAADQPEAPEEGFDLPEAPTLIVPRGWFGFGFNCGDCYARPGVPDSGAVWLFGSLPRVYSVDLGGPAARAGVRRGDVITHIDGISILSPEGGRRFGAIRPGQAVRWTLLREGAIRTVVAQAAERPGRPDRRALTDLRNELGRLNDLSDVDQMRRELAELSKRIDRIKLESVARTRYIDLTSERAATAAVRRLRYAGVIGGTEVEVRGPGSVIVSESDVRDELVINTGDAVVVIRVPDGMVKKRVDKKK
jgi:hypothetical protein